MVTHSSTSRPVQCLCMAERTGCPVLTDLWSYVLMLSFNLLIIPINESPSGQGSSLQCPLDNDDWSVSLVLGKTT
jgi:hypothetical protein